VVIAHIVTWLVSDSTGPAKISNNVEIVRLFELRLVIYIVK